MNVIDNVVKIIKNLNFPAGVDFAQLISHIRQRLISKKRRPKENMAEIVSNALAQAVHEKKLVYQSGRYKENFVSNCKIVLTFIFN